MAAGTSGLLGEVLLLNGDVVVGEDADVAGNVQGGFGDFTGREFGLQQQCAGSGLGEGAAGTHGDQAVFGLNDVTVAGNDQRGILIGDCQHGLQAAQ